MTTLICFMAALLSFVETVGADLNLCQTRQISNKEGIQIYYKVDQEAKTASIVRNRQLKYSGPIILPSQIDVEGLSYIVTTIAKSAFEACEALTAITLPESVTTIEDNAFYKCSVLTELIIPPTVTTIGSNTLSRCTNLKTLIFEDGPEPLNINHNLNNTPLEKVYLGRNISGSPFRYPHCNDLSELIIGDQVTTLPPDAFSSCIGLQKVTLPESLQHIPYSTFRGCSSLTEIVIPKSILTIGEDAFRHCEKLTEITIPNSVTFIDKFAFEDCPGLKKITIEDGTAPIELGYSAFCHHYVESLYIGRNFSANGTFSHMFELREFQTGPLVTAIEEYAFMHFRKLTRLDISDSIYSIGDGAFSNCYGLKELTIPASVISIGEDAFAPCHLSETGECWTSSNITVINCKNPIPPETASGNFKVVKKRNLHPVRPHRLRSQIQSTPPMGNIPKHHRNRLLKYFLLNSFF